MVKVLYPTADAVFYIETRTPTDEASWAQLQQQTRLLADAAVELTIPRWARGRQQWLADAKLLVDAFTHTLDQPEKLLPIYAHINRIRLCASQSVLIEAEHVLRRITEQYFLRNLTIEELTRLARSEDADPLKAFGEACRAELKSVRTGA